VLLVDDDEELRGAMGAVLQAEGFEMLEARNGLHALQQLLRPPLPGLILLDLVMPVMTGLEFLEYKAQDPRIRDIPVIALTAYDTAAPVDGVVRVVSKPFDLAALLELLRSVLG
jgi:CheY-like chemotaxis protein